MSLRGFGVLVVVFLHSVAAGAPAPETSSGHDAFVSDHLARLAAACAKERIDPWCRATGFSTAARSDGPEPGSLLGVATFLETAGVDRASLARHERLASLSVREFGDTRLGLIANVGPRNASGQQEVARLRPLVVARIGGGPAPVIEEPGLSQYLASLPVRANYPLAVHPRGWRIQGGSNADLRRVGSLWVAVEVPRTNPLGVWLSLFRAE